VTGAFGLIFLGSLLAARPITFALGRTMMATTPGEREAYDALWDHPGVRAGHRRTTSEWGAAFLLDAGLRAVLAFVLAPGTLLVVSPLLAAAVLGPVALATVHRRRRAAARADGGHPAAPGMTAAGETGAGGTRACGRPEPCGQPGPPGDSGLRATRACRRPGLARPGLASDYGLRAMTSELWPFSRCVSVSRSRP
jgi:hypothetical protein